MVSASLGSFQHRLAMKSLRIMGPKLQFFFSFRWVLVLDPSLCKFQTATQKNQSQLFRPVDSFAPSPRLRCSRRAWPVDDRWSEPRMMKPDLGDIWLRHLTNQRTMPVVFVRRAAVEGPEFSRLCADRAWTSHGRRLSPCFSQPSGSCEINSGGPRAALPLTAVPPARSLADDEDACHSTERPARSAR